MTVLELSRWQFGITTVYHFIFVPLTLSLSYLVAVMQTLWRVKKDDVYLRMTKFFGKIFLINFAVGVVTGIVQEFQIGMNWSAYSRFATLNRPPGRESAPPAPPVPPVPFAPATRLVVSCGLPVGR
jgi:cytochrome bd-type quinol oxidase subunit 1